MAKLPKTIKVKKLENLVVTLKVTNAFKLRVFVALKIMCFAVWILGGKTKVEIEGNDG